MITENELWSLRNLILTQVISLIGLWSYFLHTPSIDFHLYKKVVRILPHEVLRFPWILFGKYLVKCLASKGIVPGLVQLVKNPPSVWETWVGRSPGEGKVYPLQYSGLENSMDIVHRVSKSRTPLNDFHLLFFTGCFTMT